MIRRLDPFPTGRSWGFHSCTCGGLFRGVSRLLGNLGKLAAPSVRLTNRGVGFAAGGGLRPQPAKSPDRLSQVGVREVPVYRTSRPGSETFGSDFPAGATRPAPAKSRRGSPLLRFHRPGGGLHPSLAPSWLAAGCGGAGGVVLRLLGSWSSRRPSGLGPDRAAATGAGGHLSCLVW